MPTIQDQIDAAWKDVVISTAPPNAQALFGRSELKIDARKALEAIGKTISAVASAARAHATLSPLDVGKFAIEAMLAVAALKAAILTTLNPAEFLLCVIVSRPEPGKKLEEIQTDVAFYLALTEFELQLVPASLGISVEFLEEVKKDLDLAKPNALENIQSILKTQGECGRILCENFASKDGGPHAIPHYRYNSQLVTLRFS
jgi:hypothetical protein